MNQVLQLSRFGLFDARVPRYTSYPAATRFGEGVGAAQHETWVAAIPEGSRVSLYLHVPFCRRLCWFCACRTQGTATGQPVADYIATLKAELALLARRLPGGVTLSRLHWGGGTPTLMSPDLITDLARAIFAVIPAGEGMEFSVEIDPNEIDTPRLEALAAAGMNRASIGVQDFDPEIQQIIGREQSFEITQAAAEGLRAHGIRSLNADILFGLPKQTRARMAESVQKLLTLSPDRVALYGYAHVPWVARRQAMIPTALLPRPEERLELFETARRLFAWDGYDEIGIDHFARPDDGLAVARREGRLRRNFQGYTDDTSGILIGIGASAISRFPQGFAQNHPATSRYTRHIRDGEFAAYRGHVFTGDDKVRGRMIEALMCDFRIDKEEILAMPGADRATVEALFARAGKEFSGMLDIGPGGLSIPEMARPLTRMIARVFDAYDMEQAGHSSAI